MMKWLKSVLSRIEDGSLLPTKYYGDLDCDAALDARDRTTEFDVEWARLYDEIKVKGAGATTPTETLALAEDIRRESFFAVGRATGHHEIASYVSDDFD